VHVAYILVTRVDDLTLLCSSELLYT